MCLAFLFKEEVRGSFITTTVLEQLNNVPGHSTRAPQVGFELVTNCIQFYAIANLNLDKTSLQSAEHVTTYYTQPWLYNLSIAS